MTSLKEKQIFQSFEDKEFRDGYVDEHVHFGVAYQIRSLREKYGWTQEELAEKTGKAQETISQWENPDYGSYTLKTLKSHASAFDVALMVHFVSFREIVRQMSNLTPEIIAPQNYSEERQSSFAQWGGNDVDWPESDSGRMALLYDWRNLLAVLDTGAVEEGISEAPPSGTVIAGIVEEGLLNAAD